MPGVVILMHGSEGTTWFCDMLDRHPEAGQVLYEPFREKRPWGNKYSPEQAEAVFRAIYGRDVDAPDEVWTGDGLFPNRDIDAIRANLETEAPFIKMRRPEIPRELLMEMVRKYEASIIVMSRENRVKQGISQVRKRYFDLGQRQYKSEQGATLVDFVKAKKLADQADEAVENNLAFAEESGRPYLHVRYEDLMGDLAATMHKVAEFAGIDPEGIVTESDFVKITPDDMQHAIANYCDFYDFFAETKYKPLLEEPTPQRRREEGELIQEVISANEDNAAFLGFWGAILSKMGRLSEAEAVLRRSVEMEPAQAEYLRALALLLERQKCFFSAIVTMRKAVEVAGEKDAPTLVEHLERLETRRTERPARYTKALRAARGESVNGDDEGDASEAPGFDLDEGVEGATTGPAA